LNVVKVMPESAIKFGAYEVSILNIWFRRYYWMHADHKYSLRNEHLHNSKDTTIPSDSFPLLNSCPVALAEWLPSRSFNSYEDEPLTLTLTQGVLSIPSIP
jgi:hypothetical protein